ncbi:hypothetical protein M8C21_011974, partial [Ambrosia artemisiifolia]
ERRVTETKLIFGFLILLYASIFSSDAPDTISTNQTLRYNETIVSPQQTFELGFFSPPNSMNHYVGIWYKKISNGTVVWVANRDAPLTNTSGELTLTLQGVLVIRDATMGNVVWSSANSSTTTARNPIGRLLDTGNFIIHDDTNPENLILQSFNLMTDTLLPGMKMGWNLGTRTERHYTSWKSADDPASGEFSYSIDINGYPQLILRHGEKIRFRAGPWNGLRFSGAFNLKPNIIYNFTFVLNDKEIYYQYNLINTSVYTRLVLKPNGRLERLLWVESINDWNLYLAPESDICDRYAGFEPKSPDQWRVADWSQGCRHTIPLDCDPGEGFNKYSNLKLPDTQSSWYNQTMTLVECEKICKSNCSCTAYTNSNVSGTGSGCLLWYGDLIDIRTVPHNGDTIYIRMSPSELESTRNNKRSALERRRIQVIVPMAVVVLITLISIWLFYRFIWKKKHQQGTPGNEHDSKNRSDNEDLELPLFGLSTLLEATNNFSMNNKLGEGGFGPVYK